MDSHRFDSQHVSRVPMFPLGSVLLPGEVLPLHIFEPRYRALVDHCMTAEYGPRFGVVLIERGHEVGGGDTRGDVATIAEITRCLPMPDGRYVLECIGTERARVTRWLEDDPFPRADLETWPDAEPASNAAAPDVATLISRVRSLLTILMDISSSQGLPEPELPSLDALSASAPTAEQIYAVAAALPLGPSDRLRILSAPSLELRTKILTDAVDDVVAVAEFSRLPPR